VRQMFTNEREHLSLLENVRLDYSAPCPVSTSGIPHTKAFTRATAIFATTDILLLASL
jgi:hypothetical protein